MPDGSKHTFNTLARESAFGNPSTGGSTFPILNEFVAPHIESFNALFDDSGLPFGDGDGRGLLSLAIKDIGERVVFDRAGQFVSGGSHKGWGNRLSSKNPGFSSHELIPTEKFKFGSSKSPSRDLWFPTETDTLRNARSSLLRWASSLHIIVSLQFVLELSASRPRLEKG